MINKGIDPITGESTHSEELFSDENTEKRIQKHFSDINDVISEQDILNVKTNFNAETSAPFVSNKQVEVSPKDDEVNEDIPETGKVKEPEPIVSSWNMLS